MPPRVSDDVKECIIRWYYIDMITMEEIRDRAKCSIGLVYNVIRNYREFGQVRNPFALRAGRPCTLTNEDLLFVNALLEANPSLYLDELQQKLSDIRDVHVSIPTISRTLIRRINLSRKGLTKAAAERNEEVHAALEGMMSQYQDPDLFVALDESAVDDKTGQRMYGWSPVGTQCVRRMSFIRGVRYSGHKPLGRWGTMVGDGTRNVGAKSKDKPSGLISYQCQSSLFGQAPDQVTPRTKMLTFTKLCKAL